MYHSISTSTNPLFARWAVSPTLFDEHLSYLGEHGYTTLTVTDLVRSQGPGAAALPTRPVVLTFDDAYADFYEQAFPALRRHGCPATLYVPTAYVGGATSWLRAEGETALPMVSWDQLTEMSAAGIECGGHSHHHVQLDAIPVADAGAEIRRCKALLEEHLGREVSSFAYPHGWSTGAVKRMVRAAGFTSACAVKNMPSSLADDPFELSRLVVTGTTSVAELAHLLTHRRSRLEVTLRGVARPLVRLAPRSAAWLRTSLPAAKRAFVAQ
jgi:peptidoglycan/xylan/chitin deacetylase (PgdA/CDA1 family)